MYKTLVILLLIFWGTRIAALDALPLHNDEGLHLTRAVEVWNLHPFWEIRDGKIVNHWLIAAFYPQSAPAFVGRIATVFVAMIGLAAGLSIVRRIGGVLGMIVLGILWLQSSYLYFYERLAFSDAEAGALVVLALWAAWRLASSGRRRDAVLTGVCFGLAMLFKFTAAPFALSVAILVLAFARYPVAQRMWLLAIAALIVGLMFVVPVGYLLLRGEDLFGIALGWIGGGSGGAREGLLANLTRFWQTWSGFDKYLAVGAAVAAIFFLFGSRRHFWFGLAALVPLAVIIVLGREALPRHFVVVLPALFVYVGSIAGGALDYYWNRSSRTAKLAARAVTGVIVVVVAFHVGLRLLTAPEPLRQPLPAEVRAEHITDHSAGYGLREAVSNFPNTIVPADTPILGSMFPDSCRRANFYAVNEITMICADAPGITEMKALLAEHDTIYVLTDTAPLIGADMETVADQLNAQVTQIVHYPRPGETQENAAVVLWRVQRN